MVMRRWRGHQSGVKTDRLVRTARGDRDEGARSDAKSGSFGVKQVCIVVE